MISERFRKSHLTQDDLDALKQGFACTIQRILLDHATRDALPDALFHIYFSQPPNQPYATLEIDGTTYTELRFVRGMAMYAQVHHDNALSTWKLFLQDFDQELRPILQQRLAVTKTAVPEIYLFQLKGFRRQKKP